MRLVEAGVQAEALASSVVALKIQEAFMFPVAGWMWDVSMLIAEILARGICTPLCHGKVRIHTWAEATEYYFWGTV